MKATAPTRTSRRSPADPLEGQFETISKILYETSGIKLTDAKREMVHARLSKRLAKLGGGSLADYIGFVQTPDGRNELTHMVDLLTTNKTSFFRETAHFDYLEKLLDARKPSSPSMTIWSAGCSSGEEPYTIALVLAEAQHARRLRPSRILATDLSERVLDKAREGRYDHDQVESVPEAVRDRYMVRTPDRRGVRVSDELKRMIRFARLNLMGDWPMKGPFDVIFCRNVMIYFDAPTREVLAQRFESLLTPGGHLFVGHSESITSLDHGLTYVQPAIYRRDAR